MLYKMLAGGTAALLIGAFAAGQVLAQDDVIAEGEKVFKRCAACHQIGPEAENKVGPELTDVIGRTAGTVPDFKYSEASIEAGEGGLVWTEEVLLEYLENPRGYMKGTNMAFAGLKKEEDRVAVVAYIVSMQGALTN